MDSIGRKNRPEISLWQRTIDAFYNQESVDPNSAENKSSDPKGLPTCDSLVSSASKHACLLKSDVANSKTSKESAKNDALKPVLTPPASISSSTFSKGVDDLENVVLQAQPKNERTYTAEELLYCASCSPLVFLLSSSNFTNHLAIRRQHIQVEQAIYQKQEKSRLEHIEKQNADLENIGIVDKASQGLSTLGLISAGVGGILAGQYALGIGAALTGTLLAIDHALDDITKKTIISWIYQGPEKDTKYIADQVKLFCSVSSYLLSIGLQGPIIATCAMKITDIILTAVRGGLEYKNNVSQAIFTELDHACTRSGKRIESIIENSDRCLQTIHEFYENIAFVQKKRNRIISSLFQQL